MPASRPGGGPLSDLVTSCPPTRKAFGKPKLIYTHAFLEAERQNETMSTDTAVKTGVKNGMASQAMRGLHLLGNSVIKSSKFCI